MLLRSNTSSPCLGRVMLSYSLSNRPYERVYLDFKRASAWQKQACDSAILTPPSAAADECKLRRMQLVHIYLNFPGTTKAAFEFYASVFGTKIGMMQTFGETSFMPNVPDAAKEKIMHAQLPITETFHLMGSDVVEGFGPKVTFGNNFYVSVVANDKAEADRVFAALSGAGGSVEMPLANAPWGPYFGMCSDHFGTHWMVSLPTPV